MSWEKPRKNYGFSMGFRGFPADFLWFHHVSPWISARSQHQTPPQITCHRAMVARRRSRTGAVAVLLLAAAVLREAFVVPGGFAIGFDGKFPVFFICSWDLGKFDHDRALRPSPGIMVFIGKSSPNGCKIQVFAGRLGVRNMWCGLNSWYSWDELWNSKFQTMPCLSFTLGTFSLVITQSLHGIWCDFSSGYSIQFSPKTL
jgi:hypothetical protein